MMSERSDRADDGAPGFLNRWSRRKAGARQGATLAGEPTAPSAAPAPTRDAVPALADAPKSSPDTTVPAPPPPPSLADAHSLTRESDFSPFMARGVAPGVRNAAMKKLFFSDPHFNVMDGLDIYIDDYTKPAPLTTAMLKSMTSARFLGLFDDHEKDEAESAAPQTPAAMPHDAATVAEAPAAARPEGGATADPAASPVEDDVQRSVKRESFDDHPDL